MEDQEPFYNFRLSPFIMVLGPLTRVKLRLSHLLRGSILTPENRVLSFFLLTLLTFSFSLRIAGFISAFSHVNIIVSWCRSHSTVPLISLPFLSSSGYFPFCFHSGCKKTCKSRLSREGCICLSLPPVIPSLFSLNLSCLSVYTHTHTITHTHTHTYKHT